MNNLGENQKNDQYWSYLNKNGPIFVLSSIFSYIFQYFYMKFWNLISQLSCEVMLKISSENIRKCRRKSKKGPILIGPFLLKNITVIVRGLQIWPKHWPTGCNFWANNYLEIMFSKFPGVTPLNIFIHVYILLTTIYELDNINYNYIIKSWYKIWNPKFGVWTTSLDYHVIPIYQLVINQSVQYHFYKYTIYINIHFL